MAPADHPGLQVSSISLCVWMCNSGSHGLQVATGRPDTTRGLWHRLDCKYPFTAFFSKALSHLLALTMVNALVCGAVLYSEYKGT